MRLYDLVDDRQPEPGTAFKVRLEWLENFLGELRWNPRTRIANPDAQKFACGPDGNCNHTLAVHGSDSIFQQVPEDLFHAVSINGGEGMLEPVFANNRQFASLGSIGQQHQRV